MLRFLHAGDLHLGSPFAAFSKIEAARRRERQFTALSRLFDEALSRGAGIVLLAGDVFDTPEPDAAVAERFFSMLGDLPVPVVIAPGNHDYRRAGGIWDRAKLPSNVFVFAASSLSSFDFPALGLTVFGYAFTGENLASSPDIGKAEELPQNRVSVLLAHADVTSPLSPYAPLTSGQLEMSGYAYAALGHVHKRLPPRKYGKTMTAYSGFFAGRGFDEVGAGQALLIEIEGSHLGITPLETESDRFEIVRLDCTGAMTGEEIRRRVSGWSESCTFPPETAVRLVLDGNVGLSCKAEPAALLSAGARFALFEVADETMPLFDAAYLEKDPTLRGAFYRAMLPRLSSPDEKTRLVAAAALRVGFAALSGKEV